MKKVLLMSSVMLASALAMEQEPVEICLTMQPKAVQKLKNFLTNPEQKSPAPSAYSRLKSGAQKTEVVTDSLSVPFFTIVAPGKEPATVWQSVQDAIQATYQRTNLCLGVSRFEENKDGDFLAIFPKTTNKTINTTVAAIQEKLPGTTVTAVKSVTLPKEFLSSTIEEVNARISRGSGFNITLHLPASESSAAAEGSDTDE